MPGWLCVSSGAPSGKLRQSWWVQCLERPLLMDGHHCSPIWASRAFSTLSAQTAMQTAMPHSGWLATLSHLCSQCSWLQLSLRSSLIAVGVVAIALAMPRPHHQLLQEPLAPGGSPCSPGVSLPQETPCTPISSTCCGLDRLWSSCPQQLASCLYRSYIDHIQIHIYISVYRVQLTDLLKTAVSLCILFIED